MAHEKLIFISKCENDEIEWMVWKHCKQNFIIIKIYEMIGKLNELYWLLKLIAN